MDKWINGQTGLALAMPEALLPILHVEKQPINFSTFFSFVDVTKLHPDTIAETMTH